MTIDNKTKSVSANSNAYQRLGEIDLIVGFAIILVVLGHFADRSSQGIDWYVQLKIYIYKFHMPLFIFSSGVIAFHIAGTISSRAEYVNYCKNRFRRLAPPFLIFGLSIVGLKWLIQTLLSGQLKFNELSEELFFLFFFTSDSAASFLWYLVVLFQLLLISPILIYFFKFNLYRVLAFSIILNASRIFVEYSNFLMFDFFIQFMYFFVLGQIYYQHRKSFVYNIKKKPYISAIIFFLFLVSFLSIELLHQDISKYLIGTLSIPAFTSVFVLLREGTVSNFLIWISEYSLTIYLMNSIVISTLRFSAIHLFGWSSEMFALMSPLFLVAGIFIPIVINAFVFEKLNFHHFAK